MLGAEFFFQIFANILTVYIWYDYLFAHIKHVQKILVKVAEY